MDDSSNLDPLCIILVKSGAHGGKLLFRYPFNNQTVHPSSPNNIVRDNPYAMIITEDMLNHRVNKEESNIKDGQLDGLSDETLANLFSVSKNMCGAKFELKLNDVRFVGHPVSLEPDSSENFVRKTTITMFHIVFALRAIGNYSIVACYHELSQRLGLILKHEENRVGYLTQQMRSLIAAQDEVSSLPEDQQEHHFSLATERSHLARDIENMYHDLCNNGEVRMYINKWIELSFCLPQKLHKKHFPNILVEPESIFECLEALRPYHSLLLLVETQELLDQLSTDASPALRRLVRQCSPLKSLKTLAVDTDLSLKQVFELTGHLLYWGKGTVIYPLCESNLYVLSPRLPIPIPAKLKEKFSERFSDSLMDTLATFSLPNKLAVSPPLSLHQPRITQMIIWLLQHHLVIQLHTYVTLALDERMSSSCQGKSSDEGKPANTTLNYGRREIVESESGHSQNSEEVSSFGSFGAGRELETLPENDQHEKAQEIISQSTREEILKEFTPAEQAVIMSVPAANNSDDLTRFAALSKYFRGEHHLEEMMFHENCPRSTLLQLVDKFRAVLIKHEHEDPAVSMYFKGMQ